MFSRLIGSINFVWNLHEKGCQFLLVERGKQESVFSSISKVSLVVGSIFASIGYVSNSLSKTAFGVTIVILSGMNCVIAKRIQVMNAVTNLDEVLVRTEKLLHNKQSAINLAEIAGDIEPLDEQITAETDPVKKRELKKKKAMLILEKLNDKQNK